VALANATDVNRDRCHAQTDPFTAQNLGGDPTGDNDPVANDDGMPGITPRPIWISFHWLISFGLMAGALSSQTTFRRGLTRSISAA